MGENIKKIVISGINLFEGGPLSIYYDILNILFEDKYFENHEITIFVHKKELFQKYIDKIEIIELPKSRKNYIYRLYYEYIYFFKYSKSRNIDVWISLHDITPNVIAKKRYVYCHNPSPFLKKITWNIFKYSKVTCLMSIFYRFLYKINIKKNTSVIVQQNWIKEEFEKEFGIQNIIVARPDVNSTFICKNFKKKEEKEKYLFIYPVFPRVFKNFEIICEACKLVNKTNFKDMYEVIFTINGYENSYSKMLLKKYKNIKNIKWIGLQNRENLFKLYNEVDCMIFSSLLETWGLPISEFKNTNQPILLADLPYSYETIGTYEKVNFFNTTDANALSKLMINLLDNKEIYKGNITKNKGGYSNWHDLCKKIILGDN